MPAKKAVKKAAKKTRAKRTPRATSSKPPKETPMIEAPTEPIPEEAPQESPPEVNPYAIFDGKIILVRVGSHARPATEDDIEEVKKTFVAALMESGMTASAVVYVTHHEVDISVLPF